MVKKSGHIGSFLFFLSCINEKKHWRGASAVELNLSEGGSLDVFVNSDLLKLPISKVEGGLLPQASTAL